MKYKIVEYDPINNIWLLKRKIFWIFYKYICCGTKEEFEKYIKEQQKP